jgi:hypothetical protein
MTIEEKLKIANAGGSFKESGHGCDSVCHPKVKVKSGGEG